MAGKLSPTKWTIVAIILVLIIITPVQVVLNAPKYRPIVVCYNVKVIHEFFWQTLWFKIDFDDVESRVVHADDVVEFNSQCQSFLGRQNWLFKIPHFK